MRLPAFINFGRLHRAPQIALYVGFGLFVYLIAFYLSFPYARVKDQIVAMAAQQNLDVEIASAGPAFGLGISLEDIAIATRPVDGSKPTRFRIEEATARMSPLAQLAGETAYDVAAEAFGGEIDIDYRFSKKTSALAVDTREIAMAQVPGVKEAINLPLGGTLNLAIELTTPNHRNTEAAGVIDWKCSACAIGDGKAKLKVAGNPLLAEGLSLPKIRLGDFRGSIVVEKGVGKFKGVKAKSPDGELAIEGELRMADPLPLSYVDIYVTFKLSDALLKSSDKLQVLLQLAESMGKRPDGFYGFRLMGALRSLGAPMWSKTSPFTTAAPTPVRPAAAPRPAGGRPTTATRPSSFDRPTGAPTLPLNAPPPQAAGEGTPVDPSKSPNANMPRYPSEPSTASEPPSTAPPVAPPAPSPTDTGAAAVAAQDSGP